nr:hypothetical protein [Modestobacter marinus]
MRVAPTSIARSRIPRIPAPSGDPRPSPRPSSVIRSRTASPGSVAESSTTTRPAPACRATLVSASCATR